MSAHASTAPVILPPFTEETARLKIRLAEERNRDVFLRGRPAIVEFLRAKWPRELDYRLRKELRAFTGNRISVRFEYESHDQAGQWWRSHGNEHWEFDEQTGLMRRRDASINDYPIDEADRRLRRPRN